MMKSNIYLEDKNRKNEEEVLFENKRWKFPRIDQTHESTDSGITMNHKQDN